VISSPASRPAGPQLTAVSVCTKGGRSCFERRLKRLTVDSRLCLIRRSQSRDIQSRDAACGAPGDCGLFVHRRRTFVLRETPKATHSLQSVMFNLEVPEP
jgi:hypothetical protein